MSKSSFLAEANVSVYHTLSQPAIVPDVFVSNELSNKLTIYQQMRVSYYVVYDPAQYLGTVPLRLFELRGLRYTELAESWLEQVNLGLTLWTGEFEGRQAQWLRWCDSEGKILLTGDEKAEQERSRAERLSAILKAQGIDPEQLLS